MMNMIMTSAPLAMVGCGHSVTDATLGIQWHVLAMYAPSFITGGLIVRFGVERITGIGLGLIAFAAVVGIAGITVAHFWSALVLLGVGWNLAFIGATTMVTQCHRPEERNKVQAFNDFLIFGSMAVSSFSSGQMLEYLGWRRSMRWCSRPFLWPALCWPGLRRASGWRRRSRSLLLWSRCATSGHRSSTRSQRKRPPTGRPLCVFAVALAR